MKIAAFAGLSLRQSAAAHAELLAILRARRQAEFQRAVEGAHQYFRAKHRLLHWPDDMPAEKGRKDADSKAKTDKAEKDAPKGAKPDAKKPENPFEPKDG